MVETARGVGNSTSADRIFSPRRLCAQRVTPKSTTTRQKSWKADHGRFLLVCAFAEPECEVRDGLGDRLDFDRFIVGEEVVLYALSTVTETGVSERTGLGLSARAETKRTWAVTRACSTIVLASAVKPLMAQPMWRSISMIFSTESDSSKGDWVRFSTARTTPCEVWMPTVVEPSCACASVRVVSIEPHIT